MFAEREALVAAPQDFFKFDRTDLRAMFEHVEVVWDVLARLPMLTADLLGSRRIIKGTVMPGAFVEDGPVYIGEGACLEPGSYVKGPAYIGDHVIIRQGAYVRSDCILLEGSVLGHASEAKTALFLPEAKAPHFAYVGDSVLGQRVNLGAGTKLSNVPVTSSRGADNIRPTITIPVGDQSVDTGLDKFGAVLGDDVQVGCNAVLNPGTLIGPRSLVYPNLVVAKGCYPADVIIKLRQSVDIDPRRL
jgi:NDP-sugar pyrophosphorylase family protein